MSRYFIILLSIILPGFLIPVQAQKHQVVKDAKKNQTMIVGECRRTDLQADSFALWFNKEYKEYKLDQSALDQVKPLLHGVKVTLVMGTWCSDSRQQVPRFFKILDNLKYKSKKVRIICIDRDKKVSGINIESLKIQLVPTIIFYKNGIEIGRIVESPVVSLEKDLLKILTVSTQK